jgi:hypothetical protein
LAGNINNDALTVNVSISNSGNILAVAAQGDGGINGTDAHGGAVSFTSTGGDVTLGRVNAANLNVSAQGAISQESSSLGGLTISGTMTATANTGIMLNNGNNISGSNHIANFQATNSGSGDINLVNTDFQVQNVNTNNKLIQIHNAGGNVSVENTGGMTTVGLVDAPAGSVHLFTHSPLIIGTGGVSAGNGVNLAAGTSGSPDDVLTLNGVIQTTTGILTFAGNSVLPNAPIYGPNAPVFSSPNPVMPGPNYVYATSPPNSDVSLPVSTPISMPIVSSDVTSTVDHDVASTTQNQNNVDLDVIVPTNTTATINKNANDQTVGGADGEFGGGDTSNDDKKDTTQSTKPLPVCS